jgi:hypothetical protein
MHRKVYLFVSLLCWLFTTTAQNLTIPPDGGNKKASVSERIGITAVLKDITMQKSAFLNNISK